MKKVKKFFATVMAVAMAVSMMVPAMAVEVLMDPGISLLSSAVEHKYTTYKLMDLETSLKCSHGSGETHSSACYNYAYTPVAKYADIMVNAAKDAAVGMKYHDGVHDHAVTVENLVLALGQATHDQVVTFTEKVYDGIKAASPAITLNPAIGEKEWTNTPSFNVDSGYWLIVDTTVYGADSSEARSLHLLDTKIATEGDTITIAPKKGAPSVDKQVSENDGVNYGEHTNVNVGDEVFFRVIGTLPKEFAHYDKYYYAFCDTMSAGLEYNGDAKVYVYVDGNVDSKVAANKIDVTDATKFVVTRSGQELTAFCEDVIAALEHILVFESTGEVKSKIVLEYSATLTENAITSSDEVTIGGMGNENTAKIEFSNDPYTDGRGETEDDVVKVFTFQLDVLKVDAADPAEKLSGAEFVLYRKIDGVNSYLIIDGENGTAVSGGTVKSWTMEETGATTFVTDSNGKIDIDGLEEGTYYLKETEAPAGYNKLSTPIAFSISAIYDGIGAAQKVVDVALTIDGNTEHGVADSGTVSTSVKNSTGTLLPETGGIGTTIFYVVGGLLVVGAGVLLVTKKRMDD